MNGGSNNPAPAAASNSRPENLRHRYVVVAHGVWFFAAIVALLVQPDWLAPLTLVPPWCWPLIGLMATIVTRRWSRRRVAVGLFGFWMLFAFVWVDETWALPRAWNGLQTSASDSNRRMLRIISFNCDSQRSAIDDLTALTPDVVLLQESPGKEELARWTRTLFGEEGEFATCGDVSILARGKVRAKTLVSGASNLLAAVTFADGFDLDCVSLRLTPPPARLDFWSAGFWNEHRQTRETHRRQLHEIASRLDIDWTRTVIGGDFNTTPHDRVLQKISTRVTDSFRSAGRGWGATGTNSYPLFRVDQIWTNFGRRAVDVRSVKSNASDHRLVVCDSEPR